MKNWMRRHRIKMETNEIYRIVVCAIIGSIFAVIAFICAIIFFKIVCWYIINLDDIVNWFKCLV